MLRTDRRERAAAVAADWRVVSRRRRDTLCRVNKPLIATTLGLIGQRLDASLAAISGLRDQLHGIASVGDLIVGRFHAGASLYTAGNGGSAAQALHLAEELIGRYRTSRRALPAVCLNADPTALTCISNDFGFENVFARQCEALIKAGDVFIALSTSGNSANITNALAIARARGGATIGLLGNDGGKARALCDHAIVIPGSDSALIQDAHQVIIHLLCEIVEAAFCRA